MGTALQIHDKAQDVLEDINSLDTKRKQQQDHLNGLFSDFPDLQEKAKIKISRYSVSITELKLRYQELINQSINQLKSI